MLDNNDIRSAIVAWLKGNAAIVANLTAGGTGAVEIRELWWQGEDFLFPNIRVTCSSSIPTQCDYSDIDAIISYFSEEKSSKKSLVGQGVIAKQLHKKSVSQNSVSLVNMRVINLPDAVQEGGIWKADVILSMRVSEV